MVDFNGIKTFLFDLKIHQNRWQLELRPDPTRVAHGVLNTAGEDGHEGTMNLPPISISWLRHCGKFKSHQKLPFWSKMHQNRWRLGLRPRPRWGRLTSCSPDPLAVRGREERGGEGRFCPQPQIPGYATAYNIIYIYIYIIYYIYTYKYYSIGL